MNRVMSMIYNKTFCVYSNQKGFSVIVVLAALMIIAGLGFSTHRYVVLNVYKAQNHIIQRQSFHIAQAAVACAVADIYAQSHDPASSLFTELTKPDLATGTYIAINKAPLHDLINIKSESNADVIAQIVEISHLSPQKLSINEGGYDEVEKTIKILITAKAEYDRYNTVIEDTREMRVVNIIPGVLGKFVLFVNSVDDPESFNLLANKLDGNFDDRLQPHERFAPLTIFADGMLGDYTYPQPDAYLNKGYIFLGKEPVKLNLTSGNNHMGENFIFTPITESPAPPTFYSYDPPVYFSTPPDFQSRRHSYQSISVAFLLYSLIRGYHTADNMGNDMRLGSVLSESFPDTGIVSAVDPRMRSSVLHLFGNYTSPAPTVVFGQVHRSYAHYNAVQLETTGNQTRDAALGFLPQTSDYLSLDDFSPPVVAAPNGDLPPGEVINLPPDSIQIKNMFNDSATYQEWISDIKVEPYTYGYHRQLVQLSPNSINPDSPLPFSSFFPDNFELEFHVDLNRKDKFFENSPSAISDDFLLEKIACSFDTNDEFMEHYFNEESLSLGSTVIIKNISEEICRFPESVNVEKGGIIIVENGDIAISSIESHFPEILTIVALNGDIILETTSIQPIESYLVALRGKIRNESPNNQPVSLIGGIAVDNLDPEFLQNGGDFVYDQSFDPSTQSVAALYRAFISDISSNLVIERGM